MRSPATKLIVMKRTLLSLIMSNSSLARRFDWLRGWVFIGLLIVGQTLSTLYIGCKDPELLRRRSQIGQGTKTWDLVLLALFGLTFLAIPIVAALDTQDHWSEMTIWLWLIGAVLHAFFVAIITWAMAVNTHFEKTVRIQKDYATRSLRIAIIE